MLDGAARRQYCLSGSLFAVAGSVLPMISNPSGTTSWIPSPCRQAFVTTRDGKPLLVFAGAVQVDGEEGDSYPADSLALTRRGAAGPAFATIYLMPRLQDAEQRPAVADISSHAGRDRFLVKMTAIPPIISAAES